MKRKKPGPDFGWETPWDLYRELHRALGFGELWFSVRTTAEDELIFCFEWECNVGGRRYGWMQMCTQQELVRYPVRELARMWAERMKASLQKAAAGIRA